MTDDDKDCALCGSETAKLQPAVVMWEKDRTYEAVMRCKDRYECWDRIRTAGRLWPIVEPTTVGGYEW